MSNFLKSKERRGKLLTIDKFFHLLSVLHTAPRKKFHLLCMTQTNTPSLNNLMSVCERYGLIITHEKKIYLTEKGRRLIEVWQE